MDEAERLMCQRIESIERHAEVQNKETGELRDTISNFKVENAQFHGSMATDVSWIKDQIAIMNTRVWYILGSVIVGFLATIVIYLISKR